MKHLVSTGIEAVNITSRGGALGSLASSCCGRSNGPPSASHSSSRSKGSTQNSSTSPSHGHNAFRNTPNSWHDFSTPHGSTSPSKSSRHTDSFRNTPNSWHDFSPPSTLHGSGQSSAIPWRTKNFVDETHRSTSSSARQTPSHSSTSSGHETSPSGHGDSPPSSAYVGHKSLINSPYHAPSHMTDPRVRKDSNIEHAHRPADDTTSGSEFDDALRRMKNWHLRPAHPAASSPSSSSSSAASGPSSPAHAHEASSSHQHGRAPSP
ncbi:unnamed protein product [Sympodiomycopsis kandeliae]